MHTARCVSRTVAPVAAGAVETAQPALRVVVLDDDPAGRGLRRAAGPTMKLAPKAIAGSTAVAISDVLMPSPHFGDG